MVSAVTLPRRVLCGLLSLGLLSVVIGPASAQVITTVGDKVGIGTTSPATKLSVVGLHGDTQLRLFSDHYGQGVDGVNTALLSLWASEPGWSWSGTGIGNNVINSGGIVRVSTTRGGSYMRLLDNQIALHTIDSTGANRSAIFISSGNVGVGTTSPQSRLDVDGGIEPLFVRNGGSSRLFFGVNQANDGYGRIGVFDDSVPGWKNLVLAEGGNVGIGTTSPQAKLEVNGTSRFDATAWFAVDGTTLFHTAKDGGATGGIVAESGKGLYLGANNSLSTGLFINASGNVGIGTTSPTGRFQVAGMFSANAIMDDGNDRPSVGLTGAYPQLVMMAGGSGNGNHGPTLMLGAFDSGTSGAHKHWSIGTSGQGASFLDIGYHAGTDLNPHAGVRNYGGATFFTILNTGNVGIGTTNPTHKLTVNGQVKAKGFLADTSNWADFVFEPDYRLAPLPEVEAHIREKGHLPGIPSAAEVQEQGVDLMAMQVKLLAKVEELHLHLIQQAKDIAALKEENAQLRQELSTLNRNP
ncbi:MAG: hypothetical protein ACOZE5_18075 [Verrucomicrobiota bacterium]